jgi:hypothetical protein
MALGGPDRRPGHRRGRGQEGIDAWKGDNCCLPLPSAEFGEAGTATDAGCADDCCQTDLADLAMPAVRRETT